MNKRTINIIIGIVLALFAIFMINHHLARREALIQELIRAGEIVEVVIAKVDIPKETTVTVDMVGKERVRRQAFQPGDLTSVDSAINKFAEVDILKGQHINSNMVRSFAAINFLSQAVPQGMRAITVPVNKIIAVEGLVKPGDKIDIIGSFDIPQPGGQVEQIVVNVFQGVKVLATNRNLSQYRTSKEIDTVTIALAPEDIKTLTYMMETSRMRLVLRAPLDTSQEFGYQAVTFETLMRKFGMWQPLPQEAEKETIDVYIGTQREEVDVSK